MFESLQNLFSSRPRQALDQDVKYVVQAFLQKALSSDAVVCQEVRGGVVYIRVGSPALYEAVRLMEYDLRKSLKQDTDYAMTSVKVIIG